MTLRTWVGAGALAAVALLGQQTFAQTAAATTPAAPNGSLTVPKESRPAPPNTLKVPTSPEKAYAPPARKDAPLANPPCLGPMKYSPCTTPGPYIRVYPWPGSRS